MGEYRCSFHGIGIEVLGSPEVVSALASRLGQMPGAGESRPEFHFEFSTVATISDHRIVKPPGAGRHFYAPLVGEALYYPDEDVLYLDYGGRVRTLCRPREGECRISMLEPELEQLWIATHPLFTIPLIEMLKRRGKFNIHAAAFARNGSSGLISGTTGAGKSTLSIALLRAGFDFICDDMAFLERVGRLRVLAFPENIDITDTTASFFEELRVLTDQPRRPGWPKHEVSASAFFPTQVSWETEPKAILFPRISNVEASVLSEMGRDEAFRELAPTVLLTDPASTRAQFDVLAELVRTTPAYRLQTGRDFDQIAGMLGETLR